MVRQNNTVIIMIVLPVTRLLLVSKCQHESNTSQHESNSSGRKDVIINFNFLIMVLNNFSNKIEESVFTTILYF